MDSQKTPGGLGAKEIAVLQEFSEASRRQGGAVYDSGVPDRFILVKYPAAELRGIHIL